MATLTQTVGNIRRVVIVALVAVVLIVIGDLLLRLITYEPPVTISDINAWVGATEALGQIPAPEIPSLEIGADSEPVFAIDGDLPSGPAAPETAFVYSVPRPRETLTTVDEAVSSASALGFFTSYEKSLLANGVSQYIWSKNDGVRTLEYQIGTEFERWTMKTQFNFDANAQLPKSITTDTTFYERVGVGVLSALGFNDSSLTGGEAVATLGKLGADGFLTQPTNPASADYVDLQFYHKLQIAEPSNQARTLDEDYDELESVVYREDPREGSLSMIVSDELEDPDIDIYRLDFNRFTYEQDSYGVYNVVSPAQAWERIRQGQGSLTLLQVQPYNHFGQNRQLSVRQFTADAPATQLAFFEPEEWTGYLYPIYVFEGRVDTIDGKVGRFVFYVDALDRLTV